MSKPDQARRRPPLWFRVSIAMGNSVQLATAGSGVMLLHKAGLEKAGARRRMSKMLGGWLAIYVSTHAIAHWLVGRAVGIRFRAYGVRGTDHPHVYPPGVRQIMSILPLFTAITDKRSLRDATPRARAAMLVAGQASTTLCSALAALYAHRIGTRYSRRFTHVIAAYTACLALVTAIAPEGDFARARAVLRAARDSGRDEALPRSGPLGSGERSGEG